MLALGVPTMRSLWLVTPAALLALAPLSARQAAADDEETYELRLLPKVEKGKKETIDFEGSLERETKKKNFPVTTFSTKATREIVALDDDGRAASERYDTGGFHASVGGTNSWQANIH